MASLDSSEEKASPAATPGTRASEPSAFGSHFWFTYLSNSSMMVAVSLLFRYADFVKLLGGTELNLGVIVGVGMVGSLFMRIFQGLGIDAFGPRRVWLVSAAGFVVTCLAHLWVKDVHGPAIFILQVLMKTSIAGFFGASITYVSGRSPIARIAEVVGNLGTSGFVGMVLGTTLGDLLLGSGPVDRDGIDRLFIASTLLGCISVAFAWIATRGQIRPATRRARPPILWILRRYHPGVVLLVGVAMGFGLGLPPVFLRPYLAELGMPGLSLFFSLYTATAFVTRLSIRRMPEQHGIRPMILLGMGSLVLSMLLFLPVDREWLLVAPALALGVAHASLFPSVVAGGSGVFPVRYRGLGTTLVLAMFDLGNLIGSPTVGGLLAAASYYDLPRFPTMFIVVAALLTTVGAIYAIASRHDRHVPGMKARRKVRRTRRREPVPA